MATLQPLPPISVSPLCPPGETFEVETSKAHLEKLSISSRKRKRTIIKMTRREKVFLFILINALILSAILLSLLIAYWIQDDKPDNGVCLSQSCIRAAGDILARIDPSVDPCDDFYQFACGQVDNEQNVIPDHKSSISAATDFQLAIDKKLRVLLVHVNETDVSSYLYKMKTFHTKCLNYTEHEEYGDAPLRAVLEHLGGWPVAMGTNWTADSFNLTDYLVNMKHLGYNHDVLAKFEVNYHVIVYKYNYIYIGNANLGLEDRSYYLDKEYEDTMEAYLGVMIEAAIRLGAEPEVATAEMEQVLQFEKEIAQLLPSRDFRMNILNYRNFSALDELAPFLDWRSYVNGVLSPFVRWPESDPIIVQNPYFIGNISNLVMATDKRTLSNYLGWQVILESLPGLDDKWARLGRRMWIKLDGRPKLRPKWEYCLSTTKRFYPIGMSSLFVGSLSDTAKAQVGVVKDIVGYVIKAFQGIIKTNDWMDHETIDQAINKTNHINVHAGFPRELFNQSLVDQEYILDDFNSTQSYFMITLIVRRARMDKKYRTLHEFNVKGHWREYAKVAEVNAFYRPAENSIDFPISIIGAMDIDGERPMYLNFGKIGWVVGHEITHGFDNNGRHFDGKGEYRSWWSNLTSDMYDKKATCFSGQYSAYDIAGTRLKINGKMTMGENIADNGGMKESFKAYQEYVNTHGSERALPGLPYTPEQILFIESASFYCGKTRRQVAEYALKTEQHAPSKYRVIGTMSNTAAFAHTFGCKPGAPMNPGTKCSLW